MVRVPATQYHLIARPLDVGAMGSMVPMVETEEQARLIVALGQVPPAGARGAALRRGPRRLPGRRRAGQDAPAPTTEILLIAQIETARGWRTSSRSPPLEGIDVLWIGHFDLTTSMGIPAQFAHPDYLRAVERVSAPASVRQGGRDHGSSVEDAEALRAGLPHPRLLGRRLDLPGGAAAGTGRHPGAPGRARVIPASLCARVHEFDISEKLSRNSARCSCGDGSSETVAKSAATPPSGLDTFPSLLWRRVIDPVASNMIESI